MANLSENGPLLMQRYMETEEEAGVAAMVFRSQQDMPELGVPVATILAGWRRDEGFVAAQLRLERFVQSSDRKGPDILGATDDFLALLDGRD